ncbi:hypothetical protein [Noviherbaspirillum pedocola]|uniref:Uncharacterized protein n=1 Tax=Noviherbaspirillum pedocola TaxID=2801341 RepID=A0A934W0W8_9BURK|nr:hypothetical protein [Noviherbaspirillum pedocola]MBK4734561.1 hypothetical protein [Noviherbaspirillum pedocola]
MSKTGAIALVSRNRSAPCAASAIEGPDKASTSAPDQDRQSHANKATDLNRRHVGRFLSPVKKAIRHFSGTAIGAAIKQNLDNSDLAHRMSFEDIRRCLDSYPIDSERVEDMIRTLTIPARDYGGVLKGDRQYYDYVKANTQNKRKGKQKEHTKAVLAELLNSSPFNLRPGNSAENRSLGKAFDPNLDKTGKKTPLSQSIDDLGKKHTGILSPAKDFNAGINRRPDNVDQDATPEHRSSTSLTREAEGHFEKSLLSAFGGAKMRKYPDSQPFSSLASRC